ncbi:hypothetical protein M673_08767 [Aureimonas sp. AU20]|nr:hypothetical protein M673_08767 [Aureimonas sp. AU20]
MARALSIDLRHRVLRAMREGASTHAAAERFGIAIATAVRWRSKDRAGRSDPLPMGGDRRSGRIEAEAQLLQSLVNFRDDITLHEMQRRLADERGLNVGMRTLWRFPDRHGTKWKKGSARKRAEAPGPIKRRQAWFEVQLDLVPPSSSSSMVRETRGSRTACRRKWRDATAEPHEVSGAGPACAWPLEDNHPYKRSTPDAHDRVHDASMVR